MVDIYVAYICCYVFYVFQHSQIYIIYFAYYALTRFHPHREADSFDPVLLPRAAVFPSLNGEILTRETQSGLSHAKSTTLGRISNVYSGFMLHKFRGNP